MAFKIIFAAVVLYYTLSVGLLFVLVYLDPNAGRPVEAPPLPPGNDYIAVAQIRDMFHYVYVLATVVILTILRKNVRKKYAIPPGQSIAICGEFEDCCCSCFCP